MHSEELGDYLGVESCTDFIPDVAAITSRGGPGASRPRRSRRSDAAEMVKYPPPIPLLARTDNLLMKKYRTSDGRLVITEERAPRHQYFQMHRSNGRLVLSLIPVDAEEESCEELRGGGGGGGDKKLGFPGNVAASGNEIDGGDKRIGGPPATEVYIGLEPCGGFGVAMAGFRPVHT